LFSVDGVGGQLLLGVKSLFHEQTEI